MPNAKLLHRLSLLPALLLAASDVDRSVHATLAQERAVFAIQADDASARVNRRWTLRRTDNNGLGLILSVVRCDDTLFLADSEYRVYSFDLRRATPVRELVSDPARLGLPRALAADCARHRLYVIAVGPKLLVTIDARSGTIEHAQSFPANQIVAERAIVSGPGVVYVGGVFNPTPDINPYRTRDADNFFETQRLGIRFSLATGAVEPLFQPYEKRCSGAGECVSSALDRLSARSGAQWIAAQAVSTRFGLYGASGELRSTHNTMSPRFVRDGTELPLRASAAIRMEWLSRNSTIRSVFGVGGLIAVVHTVTEGSLDGRPEHMPIAARPLMNIHDLNGQPLVSDIRLLNLPVGRDDANLYVVGRAEDRRGPGTATQELLQIPVKRGRHSIGDKG